MQVAYVAKDEHTEVSILDAFLNKDGAIVTIGESKLTLPMVINVSPENMEGLREVLGKGLYKWVTEFRTARQPTEAALDRFGFRIRRIVKMARMSGSDLIVVYDPRENLDLIRDEIKLWIRTGK